MLRGAFKFLIIGLCFAPLFSQAQQAEIIRGIVFKKGMLEKIASANITNLKTSVTTTSNLYGEFIARVSVGDTILIEKPGFTPYKQAITSFSTLYISLLPAISLNEVTIKGQTKKQELSGYMNDYRSKGIYYDGKPNVLNYITNPITSLYEAFGKAPSQARNFARFAKKEQEATEVDSKYTPQLVSRTTGMTGDSLRLFMLSYRPSHDDIAKWGDYEIILYIKKSYISYKKNGDIVPVNIFKSN
ncbi:hypothetical protein RG47T_4768 [Mucilaginibacter polytrichastri]|uniref:TonB-dependent receptor plug domain-containing protein n=2 Tax=Mucilaginibacter polytrichastri TaxID=1302689 RepID=A0A1Q6A5J8_9SPHI|nr:hypothetical protein RG47T_4768 [Mucilaginibacter polytrichastri]SFS75102.1 hypothetical protein SAMN04487890_103317 [Mucilaginibacter polytrichastri]